MYEFTLVYTGFTLNLMLSSVPKNPVKRHRSLTNFVTDTETRSLKIFYSIDLLKDSTYTCTHN